MGWFSRDSRDSAPLGRGAGGGSERLGTRELVRCVEHCIVDVDVDFSTKEKVCLAQCADNTAKYLRSSAALLQTLNQQKLQQRL